MKIQKKKLGGWGLGSGGGSSWGVRVDGNREVKLMYKFKKKNIFFFFWGGGGVRVDVNGEVKLL